MILELDCVTKSNETLLNDNSELPDSVTKRVTGHIMPSAMLIFLLAVVIKH